MQPLRAGPKESITHWGRAGGGHGATPWLPALFRYRYESRRGIGESTWIVVVVLQNSWRKWFKNGVFWPPEKLSWVRFCKVQ